MDLICKYLQQATWCCVSLRLLGLSQKHGDRSWAFNWQDKKGSTKTKRTYKSYNVDWQTAITAIGIAHNYWIHLIILNVNTVHTNVDVWWCLRDCQLQVIEMIWNDLLKEASMIPGTIVDQDTSKARSEKRCQTARGNHQGAPGKLSQKWWMCHHSLIIIYIRYSLSRGLSKWDFFLVVAISQEQGAQKCKLPGQSFPFSVWCKFEWMTFMNERWIW